MLVLRFEKINNEPVQEQIVPKDKLKYNINLYSYNKLIVSEYWIVLLWIHLDAKDMEQLMQNGITHVLAIHDNAEQIFDVSWIKLQWSL